MDNVGMEQYKNLRKCFSENLVKPILGKGYYNMGLDVYTCDEQATLDIKHRYDNINHRYKIYRIMFIISMCFNFIMMSFITIT